MTSRVALLPTPGDPLQLAYWRRNFERVWAAEVDDLAVLTSRQDHGFAIGHLLASTDAEYVMLCEDDAYVRRPGAVDAAFARIESGECDVIGSPRGSASAALIEAAGRSFPLLTASETGESGHALWPCFLFARRSDLLATDRHFGARNWAIGEEVLGLTAAAPMSADTFVSTSWQLRTLNVCPVGQYRATDAAQVANWSAAPWFHVGSLSTGWGMSFGPGITPVPLIGQDILELERRASWWWRFWRTAPDGVERDEYGEGLRALIVAWGLDQSRIEGWERTYQPFVTWNEQDRSAHL